MARLASIVMPAYNEEGIIEKALISITSQTIPREHYEIIVVDGHSSDRTREIAARYADVVMMQTAKHVAMARNEGAQAGTGRIVIHTDADVIMPKDWLANIVSLFKGGVVAAGGPDFPVERSLRYHFVYSFLHVIRCLVSFLGIPPLIGSNTAVLRGKFFEVGGYADIPYCEDAEIGARLKRMGRVVYAYKARMRSSSRRYRKRGAISLWGRYLKGMLMIYIGRVPSGRWYREDY